MGASAYSSDVSYTTTPGRPGPPPKPTPKGKIRPTSFRVCWNIPADNGGSSIVGYELELDGGSGWQSVYRGEDLEYLCDQLTPGTTYRVRVAAKSAGGTSDYSESCFIVTEPVAPGAPSPPTLIDKPKAMSLHLTWTAPTEDGGATITEYEIDMTSPDNTTRGVYRGRDTDCVVAGLLPGRPYLFQVRAYNRAGEGPWSSPLEVISGAGPPDKPREPKAVCKSGSSAQVTWDQPINNGAIITGYRLELASLSNTSLQVESDTEDEVEEELEEEPQEELDHSDYEDESEAEDEEENVVKVEEVICDKECEVEEEEDVEVDLKDLVWRQAYQGPDRGTDLRDLTPATLYHLRVCAVNSAGLSPFSSTVSMMTPSTHPSAPFNLTLISSTSSSLVFKWKKPAENGEKILHYNVEWSGQDKEVRSEQVYRRKLNLENLKPDNNYTVKVQAVNSRGKGPFSQPLRLSTKPLPPAPPKLECLSILHNSLKLKWADGKSGLGINYILETENSKKVWYPLYNGTAHSFKHSKLTENFEYRYRLCAATEAGQGPFSPAVSFKTCYAPPPPVKIAPRVSSITENGCLIQWTVQRGSSTGEQLEYKVLVNKARDESALAFSETLSDTQLRLHTLDAKTEYTVRVCSVRNPSNHSPLAGAPSPSTNFTTLPKTGSTVVPATVVAEAPLSTRDSNWSDHKWAVVILSGFAFFAVFIAMLIQQLISLGTVSS